MSVRLSSQPLLLGAAETITGQSKSPEPAGLRGSHSGRDSAPQLAGTLGMGKPECRAIHIGRNRSQDVARSRVANRNRESLSLLQILRS